LELLEIKDVAYVVEPVTVISGKRETERSRDEAVRFIASGCCNAAVISISAAAVSLNLQTMDSIIFMHPLASEATYSQLQGLEKRRNADD